MPASDGDPAHSGSVDVQFSNAAMPAAKAPAATPAAVARRRRAPTLGQIGESITNLPVVKEVMPRSRRAQILVRSMIVAFGLVAAWIAVIVYLQARAGEKPDFRPQIEAILIDLRDGKAAEVYDHSSTRFQERVLEDTFVDQVTDMNQSLGPFREVASVIRSEVFRGPSGKTARVDLLLEFENGRARGTMSFHNEDAQWRMVGFGIELPEDVALQQTSAEARAARVRAPDELQDHVRRILELSKQGKAEQIWDEAADVFQGSISKEDFVAQEAARRAEVGPFLRILNVYSSVQNPSGTGATLSALLEFNKGATGVTVPGHFKFSKIGGQWKLTFYKLITPMPRGRAE